jgi:hypothetical protein
MKPTHINDIKTSNSKPQWKLNSNTNNNPRTQLQWLPILLFTLDTVLIFTLIPNMYNLKAIAAMVHTALYCTWMMNRQQQQ